MSLKLKVVTPERIVFEDTVDSVTAMTESGEVTILSNHIPITAVLRPGEAMLRKAGVPSYLAMSTGFMQVRPGNEVLILADTAERMEELELGKIEEAKKMAEKILSEKKAGDDVMFANAAANLERELARYKVAIRRRGSVHGTRSPETEG